jgi:segregation and condensation protein A
MEALKSQSSFTVRTETYEGPLDLILDLIEKRKLLVNEISLSQVTDDYVAYIRGHEAFPMEDAADFIGVAATLLLIKSKSLLPELELSDEEAEDVDDLKRRLEAYERAREGARELSRLFGRKILISAGERKPEPYFAPSRDLTVEALTQALDDALRTLRTVEEKLPEARVRTTVTIEEMMDRLASRVQSTLSLSFSEFSGNQTERVEVIVSFLALLELVKQGVVDAAQQASFGDITIANISASVPRYG